MNKLLITCIGDPTTADVAEAWQGRPKLDEHALLCHVRAYTPLRSWLPVPPQDRWPDGVSMDVVAPVVPAGEVAQMAALVVQRLHEAEVIDTPERVVAIIASKGYSDSELCKVEIDLRRWEA